MSLRIAFIGGYGHHYLRGALEDPELNIEAVAVAGDRIDDPAARKQFEPILQRDDTTWFDDPVAMLDEFKPSIVNVAGIFGHKAPLSVEALRRGIPVVSEKPVATSWEQLKALREAADGSGAALLTEFNFRVWPHFLAAQAAVARGDIGEPVLATAQKSYRFGTRPDFYKRREDYGSTVLWIACHAIDAVRFVTGQRLTRVAGVHGNVSKPDYETMEDHCIAMFSLENGGSAAVHADFLRPAAAATHADDRLRIAGADGVIEVRDRRCRLVTTSQEEHDITDSVPDEPVHRALLRAGLEGDRTYFSTDASVELAAVLLAARDAADQQRYVDVPAQM